MNLKVKISAFFMLMCSVVVFAQENYTLKGVVTSGTDKLPLPGASITVTTTTQGTSSDFDGNFEITVKEGDVVQVIYQGFQTKKIDITGQKQLSIELSEDISILDEVVVVGYGTVKKSDVTGSVASVKTEELTAFPVLNAVQAIQGRAAGVEVQSNNGGEPGAPINIKIRGNTSISASSSPLIVVDGFVGASMPQAGDIEAMEILKDASATAIYGSRGANGVVLVTTKKGKSGKMNVEFNSTFAVQNTANKIDLLNATDFATYQNQVRENTGIDNEYVQGDADTDWQDLIYTQGSTQSHNVSISGGSDKINYYVSGNYFKQEGVVINSGFERGTFLSNINAQVNDKLKVGASLYGARSTKDGVATQSDGSVSAGGDDVITLALRYAPDQGIYNEDGSYNSGNTLGDPVDNPFAVASERIDETKTDNFRANFFGDYEIIENLNFKSTFGYSTENKIRGTYTPSTLTITDAGAGGRATAEIDRKSVLLNENYLTYKKELGRGNLTLLAGYSYQQTITENFYTEATGIISDSFSFYGLNSSTSYLLPDSSIEEQEIQSFFGRANYDYDDKYLLTATLRRDGSSNFAANNKYATFPSFALGWKASNEEFLSDVEAISNLKVRASWGKTGNQAISPYESLAELASLYASRNGATVSAISVDKPENPDLKWETSTQTNLGVDLGLLNNKITLSLDYYNIDTEDLLLTNSDGIPDYLGFTEPDIIGNVGAINNRGFEVSLGTKNVSTDDFSWSTDFNISFNKNEVVALSGESDFFTDAAPSYFSNTNNTHISRVGEEVGLFWGYDYAGVYQGGDLPEGTAVIEGGVAGDPLFVDVNEDGEIGDDDRTIIGNPNPDFTFGFTNNFRYKNFDLSVFFQGSQGGDVFNLTNVQLFNGDANTTQDYFNSAWTESNTDTNTPRVGNNSDREISSRFVEDGSYIRLKNVALGYNFPEGFGEKIGVSNVRIAVSAQNLLTFTNYSGLDPEVNYGGSATADNQTSNTALGADFGSYPTVKTFNFSLNVKF